MQWVHTSRYGRSLQRLLAYWLQIVVVSFLLALLVSVIVMRPCVPGPVCENPEIVASVSVATNGCALECYQTGCANMTCGGNGRHCQTTMDGVCDEPFSCPPGSDTLDCIVANVTSGCPDFFTGSWRGAEVFTDSSPAASDCIATAALCVWAGDGICDEPFRCSVGTDTDDCADENGVSLEDAYIEYLDGAYIDEHRWFSDAASADPASSASGCQRVTVVEKCSGCAAHTNDFEFACSPGQPGYPQMIDLCHDAQLASALTESDWCDARHFDSHGTEEVHGEHSNDLPCYCMVMLDRLAPNWLVFETVFFWLVIGAVSIWAAAPCLHSQTKWQHANAIRFGFRSWVQSRRSAVVPLHTGLGRDWLSRCLCSTPGHAPRAFAASSPIAAR